MTQIYEIGGCVRDEILGIKAKDVDFVFISNEKNIDSAWKELQDYLNVGGFEVFLETKDCFTIRAKFPKGHIYSGVADFVLARKETYNDISRKPTVFVGSLFDDLERRDFRCNAVAKQIVNGKVIYFDPFNGIEDIKNKVLNCPKDPVITFMDDPLRILRAIRFNITKGFNFGPGIVDAFGNKDIWRKFESSVSIDRVRDELYKCFRHDTPKTIKVLVELNLEASGVLELLFNRGLWLMPTNRD